MVKYFGVIAAFGVCVFGSSASAVTVGPGGFDGGFATTITFDDSLTRSSDNDRDNPLNALGATDSNFFELLVGETVTFTFGSLFTSPGNVVEVTFGNVDNFFESADIFVGNLGDGMPFVEVNENPIENSDAQGPVGFDFTFDGTFDALRITALSSPNGTNGFDIDSVRVSPVPLPAAGWMLVVGIGGLVVMRRKPKA